MKRYIFLWSCFLASAFASADSKGSYTGAGNKQNSGELMVASTLAEINSSSLPAQIEMKKAEVIPRSAEAEIWLPKPSANKEAVFSPAEEASAFKTDDLTQRQAAYIIAENLRTAAGSAESKFAKRVLNKAASRFESMPSGNERLTFWDKCKAKISAKFLSGYAPPGMDAADVLAIISLTTGLVGFFAYYGAFPLGVAAIVTGAIALARGTSRRGMAIAGIVLGAVAIVFWPGIIIVL
ncbi:MAG TPA: DUF4190 domain-containing protein [Chitinophagales bacterium]|nr:DUF4190 domain-containing protein [Chitinophagales bacterium]